MREITRYEADDGTIFEDEEECLRYEFAADVEKHGKLFTLLGSQYNVLDPTEPESYEDAYFIYLNNSQSAGKLYNIYGYDVVAACAPDFLNSWSVSSGLWAYDESCDEWYHVGERIAELQDMADQCMESVNQGR